MQLLFRANFPGCHMVAGVGSSALSQLAPGKNKGRSLLWKIK